MIKIDSSDVTALAKRLVAVSRDYERDQQRVLVSTRRATETRVKREIAAVYTLPQGRIKRGLDVGLVNRGDRSFLIIGKSDRVGLQNFKHRMNAKQGVRVQVTKARAFGPPKRPDGFSRAFLIPGGLIARRNGGKQKLNPKRESIEVLFGPSVADMINRATVSKNTIEFARQKLSSELLRNITQALKRG